MATHTEIVNGKEREVKNSKSYLHEGEDMIVYWKCTKCNEPANSCKFISRAGVIRTAYCNSCDTQNTEHIATSIEEANGNHGQ